MMTLGELADLMPGATLTGEAGRPFRAISTDTRHLPEEAVFFALHGERFDAHDFADQAVASGALALVVERPLAFAVPQIVVPDTRLALGAAAAGWRARFDSSCSITAAFSYCPCANSDSISTTTAARISPAENSRVIQNACTGGER